jgi:hypothetical protein
LRRIGKPRLSWLIAALLVPVFLIQSVALVSDFSGRIAADYRGEPPPSLPNDFPMFYTGARVITSGERAHTYDIDIQVRRIAETQGYGSVEEINSRWWVDWVRYYNPPVFLLLLAPAARLALHDAYLAVLGFNLLLLAGVIACVVWLCRGRPALAITLAAAIVGFTPLYFGLRHGQPTLLITLLLALAVIAAEARRLNLAAVLFVMVGAKPQFLVLAGLAFIRRWPAMLPPIVVAAVAILVLPFALVGPAGIADYVRLVLDRGSTDVGRDDFSSALLNWTGFLRAATGGVPLLPLVLLSSLTVASFAAVLRQQDIRLSLAAALLATLLVVPHVHLQDWLVVALSAALVLPRASTPLFTAGAALGFLAVYLGANQWEAMHARVSDGERALYAAAPAALALILWFAAAPWLEARLPRERTLAGKDRRRLALPRVQGAASTDL